MATKRRRGDTWEWIFKNSKLFKGPRYHYDVDESAGDLWALRCEQMFREGKAPEEFLSKGSKQKNIEDVIKNYIGHNTIPNSDKRLLYVSIGRLGKTDLMTVNYAWVERWIKTMKIELNLSPSTIRHHVGALARCFDWAANQNIVELALNPLRRLPKRYAQYTDMEIALAIEFDPTFEERIDVHRDRRLLASEEHVIRQVMDGHKRIDRERPLEMKYRAAWETLFELAIETGMRMREIYTITLDQIDLENKTVFLDKTKNGSKRQVPLSTVARATIRKYLEIVAAQERDMEGFSFDHDRLLPWWDGTLRIEKLNALTATLSQQWKRIVDYADIEDLHFHDMRHEFVSRIFLRTKMRTVDIMKITGHSSERQLARYANLRGSDLADEMW